MICLHLASSKDQGKCWLKIASFLIFLTTRLLIVGHEAFIVVVYSLFRVREFMAFTSDVLVNRTQIGQRQTVKEQGLQH